MQQRACQKWRRGVANVSPSTRSPRRITTYGDSGGREGEDNFSSSGVSVLRQNHVSRIDVGFFEQGGWVRQETTFYHEDTKGTKNGKRKSG
jgi:hypothetical protein